SDRQRACLTRSSVCWLLLLLSETVWISPTCGPVKPHGRSISDLRRRSLRVGAKRDLPFVQWNRYDRPASPCLCPGGGKRAALARKKKGGLHEEESQNRV